MNKNIVITIGVIFLSSLMFFGGQYYQEQKNQMVMSYFLKGENELNTMEAHLIMLRMLDEGNNVRLRSLLTTYINGGLYLYSHSPESELSPVEKQFKRKLYIKAAEYYCKNPHYLSKKEYVSEVLPEIRKLCKK